MSISMSQTLQQRRKTPSPRQTEPQTLREVYISPAREKVPLPTASLPSSPRPTPHYAHYAQRPTPRSSQQLPPRAVPFRRSRHTSKDHTDSREESRQRSASRVSESEGRRELQSRLGVLEKRLAAQMTEKEQWKLLVSSLELRIAGATEEADRMQNQLAAREKEWRERMREVEERAEQAGRQLRESRLSVKSLSNLKNLQTQLDALTDRNRQLQMDNQQLARANRSLRQELKSQGRESTSGSERNSPERQRVAALELEVARLKGELGRDQSQRERGLEYAVAALEVKLYEKESQLRRACVQLSCSDRQKSLSIDQVKSKKDAEVRELRQKLLKLSKDLRQAKDRMDRNEKQEKRRPPKGAETPRKGKSGKVGGLPSESQELTFELSSEV